MKKQYERHGYSKHYLYKVWSYMKSRCYNKNDTGYHNYGARGITVCEEWKNNSISFIKWAESAGWKKGLFLDRINNNSNYSPENCRFVTIVESNLNQRIRKDNSSGFRGVNYHKTKGAWIARLSLNGKRKEFHRQSPLLAAQARDNFIVENNLSHKLSLTTDGGA